MENASKALLIAGGVLIAMMILSIAVLLINNFSNTADSYTDRMDFNEMTKFNSNFEVFKGRTDVTAQELVTLHNLAKEYRETKYIDITIETDIQDDDTIEFLKTHLNDTFKCEEIRDNDNDGQVDFVKFTQNT